MGLSPFSGSKCTISDPALAQYKVGLPNPKRFRITRSKQYPGSSAWTVVEAVYPDAKNYEGRKIMVYNHPLHAIHAQTELDPHFCDDESHLAPFARFEPTPQGWVVACDLAKIMASR